MIKNIFSKVENILLENLVVSFLILYLMAIVSSMGLWIFIKSENGRKIIGKIDGDKINISGVDHVEAKDAKLQVEISGAVKNPGVFELFQEQRLVHLINLAGGFDKNASEEWITKNINLSTKLEDSQKIYIPYTWDTAGNNPGGVPGDLVPLVKPIVSAAAVESFESSSSSDGQESTGNLINVNMASQEDIDSLPGIGPVYAARIIENRPYVDLPEFKEVSGVPNGVIDNIKNLISF